LAIYVPQPHRAAPFDEAAARARSREHLETMRQRRSIRSFAPEPVPRELVENAVRVAGTSPSGANQQPWTFVVVYDEETKRRIRRGAEREEELLYRERASAEYLSAIEPIGTNASKPHLTEAPCLIAVFEQAWRREGGEKRKHYYARESVGIAVGFLVTALHLSGLATLTHAPSPMGFLREILERPDNERPFLLVAVGHPAPDAEVPTLRRKPFDEFAVTVG
jgi:nitroreductase